MKYFKTTYKIFVRIGQFEIRTLSCHLPEKRHKKFNF